MEAWQARIRLKALTILVPGKGIEPPLSCLNQILSLARLPVPPPRHKEILHITNHNLARPLSDVLSFAALVHPVRRLPVPPSRHVVDGLREGKYM